MSDDLAFELTLDPAEQVRVSSLILYIGPGFAYYVPKRVVGAKAPALRRFLHARLGARAAQVQAESSEAVA